MFNMLSVWEVSISVWEVSIVISKSSESLLSHVQSTNEPILKYSSRLYYAYKLQRSFLILS